MAAVFFSGVGAIATAVKRQLAVQITVPGPLRGRVMSVYTTVFSGSTPIGNGLTGGFGGLWGTPAALLMNGGVVLGAEVVAAWRPARLSRRRGGGAGPVPARGPSPGAPCR